MIGQQFETSTPKQPLLECGKPTSRDESKLIECAFNFDTFANGKAFCVGDKMKIDDDGHNKDDFVEQSTSEDDSSHVYHALDDVSWKIHFKFKLK